MCKVQMLRALVSQRLTAAVEEICVVFERTIAEYEEELSRTKEENERQRQLLDVVFKNPQIVLHRADASDEHLPPEQLERRCRAEQEEPQPIHIKEEEEDRIISHEGEHFDIAVIYVPVKCEDGEDKGQSEEEREVEPPSSSSTHHMTIDHCGGSQAESLLAPLSDSDDTTSHSPDADDRDSKADKTCRTDSRHFKCSECDKAFNDRRNLKRHMRTHTGEKPYVCSICGKRVSSRASLNAHTTIHTGEKPFSCSVCGKGFGQRQGWKRHMRTHTDEKPFMCLVCGRRFCRKEHLTVHTRTHTGEKPFSCSVCGKCFIHSWSLKVHTSMHTGENP